VPLFLDRVPLHTWTDQTKSPPKTYWSVVVPIIVTERGGPAPPANAPVQQWALDTANTGEAFAWRYHLLTAGLDPDTKRVAANITVTSSLGSKIIVPIRDAVLWLVSNIPARHGSPLRLALDQGIPFRDVPTIPDPYFQRPIIGIRALRKAGLKVEIDFAQDTLSLWTQDAIGQNP
jgi:hypothetical protein